MDVYTAFISSLGVSPINTALLLVIFFLAKQKLETQQEDVEQMIRKVERVERSLIKSGIELLEMED